MQQPNQMVSPLERMVGKLCAAVKTQQADIKALKSAEAEMGKKLAIQAAELEAVKQECDNLKVELDDKIWDIASLREEVKRKPPAKMRG